MRLRACLGFVLVATSACTHIPDVIRLEVDGSTVEIKKRPEPPAEGEPEDLQEAGEEEPAGDDGGR